MIDYASLCQAIQDWKAGRTPPGTPYAYGKPQTDGYANDEPTRVRVRPDEFEEMSSGAMEIDESFDEH